MIQNSESCAGCGHKPSGKLPADPTNTGSKEVRPMLILSY